MTEKDQEIIDSTIDTEETENDMDIELDLEDNNEESEETITIPKKKWTETIAQKDHWKKKATTPAKTEVQATQTEQLSVKDSYALVKADVNEEDIEDVLEYAKFKKITIAEALKSNVVKSMLAEKDEFRKSQEASTTANTRKAQAKVTPDVILENARKGKLGDSEEDIKALFRARMNLK
jgi:hypothetical protein